ncbi:MAG TPA: hypothetical protein DD727_03370 [Clostridiales bacterium]|nr:hypothetical protein [Clostridiales bacterium]
MVGCRMVGCRMKTRFAKEWQAFFAVILFLLLMMLMMLMMMLPGCGESHSPNRENPDREALLPADAVKQLPETDHYPPILHVAGYSRPIPLPHPANTAGAEDSPFILPDGRTLYLFFTPDVRQPAEKQVADGVTGLYVTRRIEGDDDDGQPIWSTPERVWLQKPGKLSMDGAVCIQDEEMWFASVREGFTGANMFIAKWSGDRWAGWKYVGNRLMKEIGIGEVHIHGDMLYFHSDRAGGMGGYDLWTTTRSTRGGGTTWSDPVLVEGVNSADNDSHPYVSLDGNELWFTRTYLGTPAIFRSIRQDGSTWSTPELVVSQFAGEPTLDREGNLYFVHHYYQEGMMLEADIYVAYREYRSP